MYDSSVPNPPENSWESRLFIMDGVISMPIAIAGYFFLPDLPETSRARYFTAEVGNCFVVAVLVSYCNANVVLHVKDIAYAKKRMELEGREQRKPYTKAKFKKIFTSWHIYGLSLLYV